MNRKAIVVYLSIAFSLAWILFCLPLFVKNNPSLHVIRLLFWSMAMWAPGVAALVCNRFVLKQPIRSLNLHHIGKRNLLLYAWLIPPLLSSAAGILTWVIGLGTFDNQFTQIREAMQNAPGGASVPPGLVVLLQILFSLTLAPLINTLFALGEELGWRGFLLPQLLPLGQGKAIWLSGVIWGIWHAPAILQGLNYPSQPYLGVIFMIVFCVLFGAFLSWLYLSSQSPWLPALAHGSLNATAGISILFLKDVNITYGGTIVSLTGWIPLGLFVGWLYWSKRLPVQNNPIQEFNVSRETI